MENMCINSRKSDRDVPTTMLYTTMLLLLLLLLSIKILRIKTIMKLMITIYYYDTIWQDSYYNVD